MILIAAIGIGLIVVGIIMIKFYTGGFFNSGKISFVADST